MINEEYIGHLIKNIETITVRLHEEACEFQLWPIDKLQDWNEGYQVKEALPGYIAFGSDGGLEMLAVEVSTSIVYAIPFIPMDVEYRIKVFNSIEELLKEQT